MPKYGIFKWNEKRNLYISDLLQQHLLDLIKLTFEKFPCVHFLKFNLGKDFLSLANNSVVMANKVFYEVTVTLTLTPQDSHQFSDFKILRNYQKLFLKIKRMDAVIMLLPYEWNCRTLCTYCRVRCGCSHEKDHHWAGLSGDRWERYKKSIFIW